MTFSIFADHAAADFGPGVSGGLGMQIVRPGVDDHGAADHVLNAEAAGDHRQIGSALAAQQRRQVPGVEGMGAALRIIVPAGVGKALPRTIPFFMDMEGKKPEGGSWGRPDSSASTSTPPGS